MAEKYLVIGAARSGLAAAEYLAGKGEQVILADTNEKAREKAEANLKGLEIEYVWGIQPQVDASIRELVMSPGVPLTIAPVKKAKELGISVIGEVEMAYRVAKAPMVAITGTNGKTTTTSLVGEIFKNSGCETAVGGNIGVPLLECAQKISKDGVIVAEISSFQLETIQDFCPKAAVILNLTPDHLDRHGDMEHYLLAKANIFLNQSEDDLAILNYDDEYLRPLAERCKGKVLFFSRKHILDEGVFVENGEIIVHWQEKRHKICDVKEVCLKGEHNLENALAAVALSYGMGVSVAVISDTLKSFAGVEHRMEPVRVKDGVLYVNDSKGTNPDSTMKALGAYDEPIVLIAGGKNKGLSFVDLAELIKKKVRKTILVGMAKGDFKEAFAQVGYDDYLEADTFEEAVRLAAKEAVSGEIVLLSPACTSWDMFQSFEERGALFKEIVNGL